MIATVWLTTAIMVVWGALIVCACMLSRVRKLTRIAVKLRFGEPLTDRESEIVTRLDGPR